MTPIPESTMREAREIITAIAIQRPSAYEAKAEIVAAALLAARQDQIRKDAEIGYRVCAETRHVTLGDKVRTAIETQGGEK